MEQARKYAARATALERARIAALIARHSGLTLETLEYLETMWQGPSPEEWAALDANARGDGEPGCRDCADYDGTCPHDRHVCRA